MASILVASVVMGLLTLAVALYVVRGREWRSYDFVPVGGDRDTWESLTAMARHPATWAVGFLLLVFGTVFVAMAAVGAIDVPVSTGVLAAPFALMLLLFLVFGSYGAVRSRRGSTAEATIVSLLVLGTLFVVAVTANLALG